jgi:hypothetical protein
LQTKQQGLQPSKSQVKVEEAKDGTMHIFAVNNGIRELESASTQYFIQLIDSY